MTCNMVKYHTSVSPNYRLSLWKDVFITPSYAKLDLINLIIRLHLIFFRMSFIIAFQHTFDNKRLYKALSK